MTKIARRHAAPRRLVRSLPLAGALLLGAGATAAGPVAEACARLAEPRMLEDLVTMIGPSEGCVGAGHGSEARCETPRRWPGAVVIDVAVSGEAAAPPAHVRATARRFAADMAAATERPVSLADSDTAARAEAEIRLVVGLDAAVGLMAPGGVLHGFNPRAFGAERVPCIAVSRSRAGGLLGAVVLIAADVAGEQLDRCLLEELYNSTGLRADPRGAAAMLDVYPAARDGDLPVMSADHRAMLAAYYAVPQEALTTPPAVGEAVARLCAAVPQP